MYKLEYLPVARQDMIDIVRYISRELSNPEAAEKLAGEMIEAADRLMDFPYKNRVYNPIRPLKQEYRRLLVQNYIIFYYVDELKKLITISRVIYARREYGKLLD
ncbi:type II toxin-antitoxin system RelE/ParE family toxin [Anaerocolumna sp. AGMB13025]|uniref:type II toxin-antitoxin system RelE/ParE family toxin n=1 Tax=Anaerocolumna sp. AGMB13025 TaxID=3039116 RepID=UPI00241C5596|nr:type II toxin-antitoxin system RelE/ParE family toxin [Anaerocolumna sp. AGMB13025]WFR55946.1 type II toxin-antitoxin system RelE/ParE family toxin [Anaerocolumna sp. AGMB13025]